MQLKDNWTHSRATFNGGTSYTVGGVRFVRGAPKPVTSRAVRKAIDGVEGFLIEDFHKEDPKPAPPPAPARQKAPVEMPDEFDSDEASEKETPAPVQRTTKKRKKVKKVKGEKNES